MRKFTVLLFVVLALCACAAAQMPIPHFEIPRNELYFGYAYQDAGTNGIQALSNRVGDNINVERTSLNGFDFQYAHYLQNHFGIILDIARTTNNQVNSTGIKLTRTSYMAGPAYRVHQWGFLSLSTHALGGVDKDYFTSNPSNSGSLLNYDSWDGMAAAGVTLDGNLSRHVGVRLGQADYLYTHHYSTNQSSFRYTAGVVVRF
jgi:hypothetical protein